MNVRCEEDKHIKKRFSEEDLMENDIEDDDVIGDATEGESDFPEDGKKKKNGGVGKRGQSSGREASPPCCQAEKCGADLSDAKRYHRRHKVCEIHAKAPVVIVAGLRQRFCQQCSRFHELMEFDESKRSCRRRLAGHNERRRKSSAELYGEGSSCKVVDSRSSKMNEPDQWREAASDDQRGVGGGVQMMSQGNPSNYKHFQIR